MSEKGRIPIYRALVRPNLFLGGERKLVLFTIFVCAILMFFALMSLSFVLFVIALMLWMVIMGALRAMGAKDPQLSDIYVRHAQKYQKYYPPYDSVWSEK